MHLNGCHNRPPLTATRYVQNGWKHHGGMRTAVMTFIQDPMTKDCQYSVHNKIDPRCSGCKWRKEET